MMCNISEYFQRMLPGSDDDGARAAAITKWLMRFFGIKEKCRDVAPLEHALIAALESRLSPEAAAIYRQQASCYRKAYWHYQEDETRFGFAPPPALKKKYDAIGPPFPTDAEGWLATVVFSAGDDSVRYTVKYYVGYGTTGTLKFDRCPSSKAWESTSVTVHEFTLHLDPMICRRKRPKGRTMMRATDLSGWVRELADVHKARDLQFPFLDEELDARLAGFEVTFPEEYIETLRETDGINFKNKIALFAVQDIYDVDLEDNNTYYLIGQFAPFDDPAYLMVKKGAKDGLLYRAGMADPPTPLGTSLKTVLHDALRRRRRVVKR